MKTVAIVVAGGRGDRMKASIPKQFMLLQHREIFVRSVEIFHGSDLIDGVVLVMHPDWMEAAGRILDKYGIDSVGIVPGGETRQESVYRGLCSIEYEGFDTVLIHDAARPLFSAFQIPDLLKTVEKGLGVVVVEPLSDTVYITDHGSVVGIPDRANLRAAETPQTFRYEDIFAAHRKAIDENLTSSTDDARLLLNNGCKIVTLDSLTRNMKITGPQDLEIAELLLKSRAKTKGESLDSPIE
ncbi:MAG TPA: 2-C-methyl-D-erythritol 4-phosphate cytidylyltransferase [Mesotoga sp.]|nr:2-C-methyl-D-erythritol 4-phosphate cytidylyltransferase [Mesotoga sp.]